MALSTSTKILFAKWLSKAVRLFFPNVVVVKRGGLTLELDLTEGIDLSIFLFGGFQKHVYSKFVFTKPVTTIYDVGANIGYMSLMFAQKFPEAKIYSFEPTHFAAAKFKKNLSLNPELAKRIELIQTFVSDTVQETSELTAYSSWKLTDTSEEPTHQVHHGVAKSTEGVGQLTLDQFTANNNLQPDLVKIDTDGYEHVVLKGAVDMLKSARPQLVFEIGQYVMEEHNIGFNFYWDLFTSCGYTLVDSQTGKPTNPSNYQHIIPAKGTTDLLAIPNN